MRKQTRNAFVVLTAMAFLFAIMPMVYADECVGQSCDANINLTITNANPTIPYVYSVSAVTLNGGTTKTVTVKFNASDSNGYADLDTATAKIELIKGAVTRSSPSCSVVSSAGDTREYTCDVTLNFYDEAGSDWVVNATIKDLASAPAENSSTTATVNALDYVSSNVNYFKWLSATLGANDEEADNPIVLTNGGNQDYSATAMTGYNATGQSLSDVIGADKFSISDLTAQTTGQIYMIDGTPVDVTSKIALATHGASVTSTIYTYVDVPSGIRADTYLSNSAWAIALS